ncbi:MAG: hypothetical protein QOD77_1403 [Thermoplasmata archaeon]|nr:hypothetical protein [Thermoplasmata archaeon]
MVAALSGVGAAVIAAVAFWAEGRRSRQALQVEQLTRLEDRFQSDSMLRARAAAGRTLRTTANDPDEVLLGFFEVAGMLLRKRALDPQMAWHSFEHWVERYWLASEPFIQACRTRDPNLWSEFQHLREVLMKIERKRLGRQPAPITPQELAEFLAEEEALMAPVLSMGDDPPPTRGGPNVELVLPRPRFAAPKSS